LAQLRSAATIVSLNGAWALDGGLGHPAWQLQSLSYAGVRCAYQILLRFLEKEKVLP
jgi:hypothetical protein